MNGLLGTPGRGRHAIATKLNDWLYLMLIACAAQRLQYCLGTVPKSVSGCIRAQDQASVEVEVWQGFRYTLQVDTVRMKLIIRQSPGLGFDTAFRGSCPAIRAAD